MHNQGYTMYGSETHAYAASPEAVNAYAGIYKSDTTLAPGWASETSTTNQELAPIWLTQSKGHFVLDEPPTRNKSGCPWDAGASKHKSKDDKTSGHGSPVEAKVPFLVTNLDHFSYIPANSSLLGLVSM